MPGFQCGFCKKVYKRESTLAGHKCTKKTRMLAKNTPEGRIALETWTQFREYNRMAFKKGCTKWDLFVESREYTSFIDFAKYLIDTQVIKQDEFIHELLIQSTPMRQWSTHKTRKLWIQTVIRREHPDSAVERSLRTIQEWADDCDTDWTKFFEEISVGRAILWIETGKISPWILHTSSSFKYLLNKMNDQDLIHIYEFIDPSVWNAKIIKYQRDVDCIRTVFKEFNF